MPVGRHHLFLGKTVVQLTMNGTLKKYSKTYIKYIYVLIKVIFCGY